MDGEHLAWLYAMMGGVAGIIGAGFIYIDVILKKLHLADLNLEYSSTILCASLSFGAGVMVCILSL